MGVHPMKVVILCGGKGTRSYPFTEYFPKPMMPICGTPIIVHLMRIYARQGFTEFILSAGHRKEILEDYFDGRFREWTIDIVDTGADADTGDRIARCADMVGETFFATYGDGLGDIDLRQLMAFHKESRAIATVTSVPLRSQYGTVVSDGDGRVVEFHEKPVLREHWINAGFFVFEHRAFDHWQGHNLESEVLPAIASSADLFTYQHDGFWKSMDTSKDQQELEHLYRRGLAAWTTDVVVGRVPAAAAGHVTAGIGSGSNGHDTIVLA
jgi:glucose-1-phosphate cytidylyltransferase